MPDHGFDYVCDSCEVLGHGTECWACGGKVRAKYVPPIPGTAATLEELLEAGVILV